MTYLQHPVDHNLHKLSHDSIRVVKDLYHLIMNLQQQQQQQRRKNPHSQASLQLSIACSMIGNGKLSGVPRLRLWIHFKLKAYRVSVSDGDKLPNYLLAQFFNTIDHVFCRSVLGWLWWEEESGSNWQVKSETHLAPKLLSSRAMCFFNLQEYCGVCSCRWLLRSPGGGGRDRQGNVTTMVSFYMVEEYGTPS